MSEYVTVPEDRAGLELDEFLTLLFPELGKGFLRREIRSGRVLVDAQPARARRWSMKPVRRIVRS